jgi:hypothetical protein
MDPDQQTFTSRRHGWKNRPGRAALLGRRQQRANSISHVIAAAQGADYRRRDVKHGGDPFYAEGSHQPLAGSSELRASKAPGSEELAKVIVAASHQVEHSRPGHLHDPLHPPRLGALGHPEITRCDSTVVPPPGLRAHPAH